MQRTLTTDKPTTLSRNQIQLRLMRLIYQFLFYAGFEEKPDIQELVLNEFGQPLPKIDTFARKTLTEFLRHSSELIAAISTHLEGWDFDRLGYIEQAILLLGATEIHYVEQPRAVAIDVAVRLAKVYGEEKSFQLINGVLDQL